MSNPTPAAGSHWQNGSVRDDDTGDLLVRIAEGNITLLVSDIEIGAVEVKDATSSDRLAVDSNGRITVKDVLSATPAVTSVNDSAANQTLLASNASRLGAAVFNDSTAVLYLKLGATASTTSFTSKVQPDGYYEVPFRYTGIIDGIWASDASGAARVTELT